MQHIRQSEQFYEDKFSDENQEIISGNGQDWLPPPGRWVKPKSFKVFLKNRASEIFVKIYRLVVYVIETYIDSFFIYLFIYLFIFGGEGGGGRGGVCIRVKWFLKIPIWLFPTIASFSTLEISIYFVLF